MSESDKKFEKIFLKNRVPKIVTNIVYEQNEAKRRKKKNFSTFISCFIERAFLSVTFHLTGLTTDDTNFELTVLYQTNRFSRQKSALRNQDWSERRCFQVGSRCWAGGYFLSHNRQQILVFFGFSSFVLLTMLAWELLTDTFLVLRFGFFMCRSPRELLCEGPVETVSVFYANVNHLAAVWEDSLAFWPRERELTGMALVTSESCLRSKTIGLADV